MGSSATCPAEARCAWWERRATSPLACGCVGWRCVFAYCVGWKDRVSVVRQFPASLLLQYYSPVRVAALPDEFTDSFTYAVINRVRSAAVLMIRARAECLRRAQPTQHNLTSLSFATVTVFVKIRSDGQWPT